MKKLFVIVAAGLILVSCKKNHSSSDTVGANTIEATINGTPTTFNVGATARQSGSAGNYILVVTALSSSSQTAGEFTLNINGDSTATTTTYSENSDDDNASIIYVPNLSLGQLYANAYVLSNPVTIKVTSINSTSVQGTFQGNLYLSQDSTLALKTVTNGKFNVNFH